MISEVQINEIYTKFVYMDVMGKLTNLNIS